MPGSHAGERSSDLFGTLSASPPQSRRKSLWKSEPRVSKVRGSTPVKHSHHHHHTGSLSLLHGISAPPLSVSGHTSHRSTSPLREHKKKKENSFLDVLFPKRKLSHAAALLAANGTPKPLSRAKPTPTPESVARGVEILKSIFPKWDAEPLQALLECNDYIMEEAISAILKMEAADESARADRADAAATTAALSFPIKNPLPDDFLRVRRLLRLSLWHVVDG